MIHSQILNKQSNKAIKLVSKIINNQNLYKNLKMILNKNIHYLKWLTYLLN